MSLLINDECIACFSCIFECPVKAISDRHDNPIRNDIFYVNPDICIECVGYSDIPICAQACSLDKVILWEKTGKQVIGSKVTFFQNLVNKIKK